MDILKMVLDTEKEMDKLSKSQADYDLRITPTYYNYLGCVFTGDGMIEALSIIRMLSAKQKHGYDVNFTESVMTEMMSTGMALYSIIPFFLKKGFITVTEVNGKQNVSMSLKWTENPKYIKYLGMEKENTEKSISDMVNGIPHDDLEFSKYLDELNSVVSYLD